MGALQSDKPGVALLYQGTLSAEVGLSLSAKAHCTTQAVFILQLYTVTDVSTMQASLQRSSVGTASGRAQAPCAVARRALRGPVVVRASGEPQQTTQGEWTRPLGLNRARESRLRGLTLPPGCPAPAAEPSTSGSSVDINKELARFSRTTAGTFAPRSSTKAPNPAVKARPDRPNALACHATCCVLSWKRHVGEAPTA